jgi:hypothetical protein
MKVEEHAEHAEHAGEHGNKQAALLIAVLAAILAICEQQAKRADIAVEENGILAADTWSEYQAKSIRQATARDLEQLTLSLDPPADADRATLRQAYIKQLRADEEHYEKDKENGKTALAARARRFETERQDSLERAHTYDNAAAALELGIVLSTASVITSSKLLLRFGYVMGAIGVVLGLFGAIAPSLVVF